VFFKNLSQNGSAFRGGRGGVSQWAVTKYLQSFENYTKQMAGIYAKCTTLHNHKNR